MNQSISEQIKKEAEDVFGEDSPSLIDAFLAGASFRESLEGKEGGVYKYLIEDKRTGKWLNLGEMWRSDKLQESEDSRWTDDPNAAIKWNTREEAEEHNRRFFNMADIEVTEHEFISESPMKSEGSEERGWIRLEDRWPEENETILVSNGEKVKEAVWMKRTDKDEFHFMWTTMKNITHWMPLPPAPLTEK